RRGGKSGGVASAGPCSWHFEVQASPPRSTAGSLALRASVGQAAGMANRASHPLLALLLASACNQQRTSDASAVDGKQNASGESAESDDASQEREDTSHDAPPPDAERAALDPTPATTATVDPRVDAPLREEAIRRALVDLAEWTKKKGGTLGASIVDVRDGRRVAGV